MLRHYNNIRVMMMMMMVMMMMMSAWLTRAFPGGLSTGNFDADLDVMAVNRSAIKIV